MKKRNAVTFLEIPEPAEPTGPVEPVIHVTAPGRPEPGFDDLVDVFGGATFLTTERERHIIEQMDHVDSGRQAELREIIRGARSLVQRRNELIAAGVDGVVKRRTWVCGCFGCGSFVIVTSGPKGFEGKSTLSGGCHECARGKKGSTTLENVEMMGEVTA